jgi:hypothetical protein
MTREDIQAEIDALIPKAETGEQWAEICRLEALMVEIAPMAEVADGFCNKLFGR